MAVRILELRAVGNLEGDLFRLQKGLKLRFTLGPLLQPYHGKLFCNHPSRGKPFNRAIYKELKWKNNSKCKCDDGDRFTELEMHIAGSFHFYFQCTGSEEKEVRMVSGYFVVDPDLSLASGGHLLLDCIAFQTQLAKCLGPLSQWRSRLLVSQQSGYNMVHLTPVQELGGSNSAYSLHDQLLLNSSFNEPNQKKYGFDDLKALLQKLHVEWNMFFVCDIVLNHTSTSTPWLRDHPESAYNLRNSTHLKPAYVVDKAIAKLSSEIARGDYESEGIPVQITHEGHIDAIHRVLREQILPGLNLWEFFGVDVNKVVKEFKDALLKKTHALKDSHVPSSTEGCSPEIKILQDPDYKRLGNTIDIKKAINWYFSKKDPSIEETEWVDHCCSCLRVILESLNNKIIHEDLPGHIYAITYNVTSTVRYERLDQHGPQHGNFDKQHPIVSRYFMDLTNGNGVEDDFKESIMYTDHCKYIVAHPGWIMGGDALNDFAAPGSFAYLRRDVIVWGDSVKLRYGERPEDSPFLWAHMMEYVKLTASIFHGIRMDNCHSTPIHVAEHFIDAARLVRPDICIVAELFTASERTDNIFVNRLGITSLFREAMSAHDSHEQGRLVYRYGGERVGAFYHIAGKPMVNSIAHALYMDVTHDNPNPTVVRSVYDSFPTAALVNMACCATGSTRGNDQFVPHHINVVTDNRKYLSWKENTKASDSSLVHYQPVDSGMHSARRALNELHRMLANQGYNQVYVDQMSYDIVAVTRHCPKTHQSVVLVAHTAFSKPADDMIPTTSNKCIHTHGIKPLHIEGNFEEIIVEGTTLLKTDATEFQKNPEFINGLTSHVVEVREHIPVEKSQLVTIERKENFQEVYFESFPPGCVIAFKISLLPHAKQAVDSVRSVLGTLREPDYKSSNIKPLFESLSLADLNRVLYRCDGEERADGHGDGAYHVPGYGTLVYCGIQGFMSAMSEIRTNDDLGHPICDNLREGNWLMDYTWRRLMPFEGTEKLAVWLSSVVGDLSKLPRFLIPAYFDVFISEVHSRILQRAYDQMSPLIRNGSGFLKCLSLGSVQLMGSTISATLPALSSKLNQNTKSPPLTMAAGLPHFAIDMWRSWGRDTFISLRGLLLVTGRCQEARSLLLAYAGCLRHGLIPNLLNGGTGARYNCRDATWWWLQAVQDYCEMVQDGYDILTMPVTRMYPSDDSEALLSEQVVQPLRDVIQEVMQRHFDGISFRERNAGPDLDRNSKDEAFDVEIGVDRETGFVYGGNQFNNGTWMDKVGESQVAGNAGLPATPRDGSAVEIVGLCKSAVRWLSKIATKKIFPYKGVTAKGGGRTGVESWSYSKWNNQIETAFEQKFWVSKHPNVSLEGEDIEIINKRGIYKDSYKSSSQFTDFQLRPNFPIAMILAPEMFDCKNAWAALEMIGTHLVGPMGVATLDPSDWAYDGVYDNSRDCYNFKHARGFNYHQGPEWVWVLGPYLRARLHFAKIVGGRRELVKTMHEVRKVLSHHHQHVLDSHWRGLPELTNAHGTVCGDSCDVQAWSMACILDVLYDMEMLM